ncbi:MAG: tRNA pseudouridine(55) synthase TruB [Candidatus Harrisonbacteria bacterium]|nr:tRNA pseudouridine(55) synthase TruB [Candidatus Harrisonbacteria bacterium]
MLFEEGKVYAINKPKGISSFQVIRQLKKISGILRIGHAGTLDPLASGVLVVAVGRAATKTISSLMAEDKVYLATLRLGATSSTDDDEGEKTLVSDRIPNLAEIQNALPTFIGTIAQVPPVFSAIKVSGKRSYALARKGVAINLSPRPVTIYAIDLISYDYPTLLLRIHCGKGVYIRSLARDLGVSLKIGAYLTDLVRERVGPYTLENSLTLPPS